MVSLKMMIAAPTAKHGHRMPETPYHADERRRGEAALAAQDGGYRDHVIGVGRVAHAEQKSEQCDSKWCGTSRIHRLTFRPGPSDYTVIRLIASAPQSNT